MKVSVIVPIYNVEEYIEKCLASLRDQTFDSNDYEVLLIDDGSTDRSGKLAEKFAVCNTNFKCLKKANGGQASARNLGLKKAKGEYILFVDSDDFVDKRYIERLFSSCINNKADISICGALRYYSYSQTVIRYNMRLPEQGVYTDIEFVLKHCFFAPWNKIYKRSLFDGLWFPEGMTYEDYALIPQVINRAKSVCFIKDNLYYYVYNDNSTLLSTQKERKININIFKAQALLEASELPHNVLEVLYYRYILASAAWMVAEYADEEYMSLEDIVDDCYSKYPEMKKCTGKDMVPKIERVFIRLLLNRRFKAAEIYVKTVTGLRQFVRWLRK